VTLVVLAAVLFALGASTSDAQTVWGLKAGLNFSRVIASNCRVDQEPCNLDYQTGFTGGLFTRIASGGGVYAFQPEALVAFKGGEDTGSAGGRNKINYFEVPMLGRVDVTVGRARPFIVVGPSLGFRLSAEDSAGNDVKDRFKSVDFGVVIGGGAAINKMIGVEARFEQSLADQLTDTGREELGLTNQPDKKINNRAITLLVDVALGK